MGKINFMLGVRPKFLWVSSILCLMGLSIIFYTFLHQEKRLSFFLQEQLTEIFVEKSTVQQTLITTLRDKQIIKEELLQEEEKTLALEGELQDREKQIKVALDQLENEIEQRREVEAELLLTMDEKRNLELKVKELTKIPEAIELEDIVIQSPSSLQGKILSVYKEAGFLVIDFGKNNNLKVGDILAVYRDNGFIGKVRVERLKEDLCAAFILPEWQGVEFRENDEIRIL